jgi:hypothetical protein
MQTFFEIGYKTRDVLARDEPTRTCCGPLPSWAPKIKTLEKIKNIHFNFENQDLRKYYRKILKIYGTLIVES